jgi:hypothetical protein
MMCDAIATSAMPATVFIGASTGMCVFTNSFFFHLNYLHKMIAFSITYSYEKRRGWLYCIKKESIIQEIISKRRDEERR